MNINRLMMAALVFQGINAGNIPSAIKKNRAHEQVDPERTQYIQQLLNAAVERANHGDVALAQRHLEQLFREGQDSLVARARALYEMGRMYMNRNDNESARRYYAQIFGLDDARVNADHMDIAELHYRAMMVVGRMYAEGDAVFPVDMQQAREMYRPVMNQHLFPELRVRSHYELGDLLYVRPEGITLDAGMRESWDCLKTFLEQSTDKMLRIEALAKILDQDFFLDKEFCRQRICLMENLVRQEFDGATYAIAHCVIARFLIQLPFFDYDQLMEHYRRAVVEYERNAELQSREDIRVIINTLQENISHLKQERGLGRVRGLGWPEAQEAVPEPVQPVPEAQVTTPEPSQLVVAGRRNHFRERYARAAEKIEAARIQAGQELAEWAATTLGQSGPANGTAKLTKT